MKKLKVSTMTFIILDILALIGFFLTYGPFNYFRNLLVATAMNTMNHQYLAYVFYSKDMVNNIINNNYYVPIEDTVDLDQIVIDTSQKTTYKDEYEEQILTRDEGNDLYKIIKLKLGPLTTATMVVVYDPTKVQVVSKTQLGTTYGERLSSMCKRYDGFEVGINSGGFVDITGYGSGIPTGYVIENGQILWSDGPIDTKRGNIIGITKEGKLLLMSNATGQEALNSGVTNAVEFGPFLIVNGNPMRTVGDYWQTTTRTAIGQRKDGVMLFLVVDGELYVNGATLQTLIDVFLRYGAYNAANLDGGQSSSLVNNKCELINSPPTAARKINGRTIVTGFAVIDK